MGRWLGQLCSAPAPGHRGPPANPSPCFLSQRSLYLRLPFGGPSGCFHEEWTHEDPCFLPTLSERCGERGPRGELADGRTVAGRGAGGGVLTSPPQRPGVQVPRAEPRRRGGPCGHALAASPRCPAGGSARAAAGAARSRAPLPFRARDAAGPAPAPGPARSEPGTEDCGRRHGSLRCVGRALLSLSSASPPRALSPAASCRTLYPFESGCFLGVASVFFPFFSLFLVANFPPQLSHVSLPSLLRDFLQPLPDLPLSPVF